VGSSRTVKGNFQSPFFCPVEDVFRGIIHVPNYLYFCR
jgi:hypothetical protein